MQAWDDNQRANEGLDAEKRRREQAAAQPVAESSRPHPEGNRATRRAKARELQREKAGA